MYQKCMVIILGIVVMLGWGVVSGYGQAGAPAPEEAGSHIAFIEIVRQAEEQLYQDILRRYTTYLSAHPDDVTAHLEHCRFIELVFYDDYEGYNLKQEEFDACLAALADQFPDEPAVLVYRSEFVYGDSAIAFLNGLLEHQKANEARWETAALWKVHRSLAQQHSFQDEHYDAIGHAEKAMHLNDTLDLSLLLAQQYKAVEEIDLARKTLIQHLDSTEEAWSLNQKGSLLLELSDAETAIQAFRYAQKDTSAWGHYLNTGRALQALGEYDEARSYFVQAVEQMWNKTEAAVLLFQHDLRYAPRDSVVQSYNDLRDLGYFADPFGRHRLALFVTYPMLGWRGRDLGAMLALLVVLLMIAMLPYLWILPIHYVGLRIVHRKSRKPIEEPSRWGLRHFWAISVVYLGASFLGWIAFQYDEVQSMFTDDFVDITELGSQMLANETLFFMTVMLIGTLVLTKVKDWKGVWGEESSKVNVLLMGGAVAFGLRFALGLFVSLFPDFFAEASTGMLEHIGALANITKEILAINAEYGIFWSFLFVVILVPIYEEIIFRGIMLGSAEKYLTFGGANVLQALFFAMIHDDLTLLPFYFAFGLLAGHLRKRSKGLAASMAMHGVNNLLAFIVIVQ